MERKTLAELLTEAAQEPARRRYTGDPPETGGTSIQGKVAPGVTFLSDMGVFQGAKKIIDYGAGKYGRNANWLRRQGFQVWAFDPFNGSPDADGWTEVSTKIPRGKFDVGFTSFVLNVVPEHIEKDIVNGLSKIARKRYHVTRNRDVFDAAKAGLMKGAQPISDWFLNEFATEQEKQELLSGNLSNETILAFSQFGYITKTARGVGFQRIPTAEDYGLKLIKGTKGSGWKVYEG